MVVVDGFWGLVVFGLHLAGIHGASILDRRSVSAVLGGVGQNRCVFPGAGFVGWLWG